MGELKPLPNNEREILEIVRGVLRGKYRNFKELSRDGKTRHVYIAEWGPSNEVHEHRVIKIDKMPLGQRAFENLGKGYGTRNDVKMLHRLSRADDGVVRLLDFEDLQHYGYEGCVSVEEDFVGCSSLQNYVEDKGGLTRKEFVDFGKQAIKTLRYVVNDLGIFHRDNKPGNWLVRKNERGLEAKLTDFANACDVNEVRRSLSPTLGGHLISDPLLMGAFTGEEREYNEKAEIYSLGITLFYAITGRYVFDYEPYSGRGVNVATGNSLLTNGRLDVEKHSNALEEELRSLPSWARRYKGLFRKCLTIDDKLRYNNLGEFQMDFNKASKGFFDFAKNKAWLALILGLSAIGGGLGYWHNGVKESLTNQILQVTNEAKQYPVGAQWDGEKLEIGNNYVGLEVDAHKIRDLSQDSKKGILCVNQGDTLRIGVAAHEHAIANRNGLQGPFIEGKVYFEGWPGKEFVVDSLPYNGAASYYGEGGVHGNFFGELIIPKGMKDGVRLLIAEFYAPEKDYNGLHFLQPGKIMNRGVLPVVVGSPRDSVLVNYVLLKDYDQVHFRNIHGFVPRFSNGLVYTAAMPEEGFAHTENSFERGYSNSRFGMRLPAAKNEESRILRIGVLSGGGNVFETYLPIKGEPIGNNYWWDFAIPDKDFSGKIEKMRLGKY